MYVCLYVCMCVCMYVYMYVSMYVCVYVYMYVCMCVCMHVCIYECMYGLNKLDKLGPSHGIFKLTRIRENPEPLLIKHHPVVIWGQRQLDHDSL